MTFKRKPVFVAIILGFPAIVCGCLSLIILQYDYGYLLDKGDNWSNFSLIEAPEDLQATLEANLTIGASTAQDVISFLASNEVKRCSSYERRKWLLTFSPAEMLNLPLPEQSDMLSCSTTAHKTIVNHQNLLDVRGYYLLCSWVHIMDFHFEHGILTSMRVWDNCGGGM